MKKTGIFYHRICGEKAYFSLAMSVKEGFSILKKEGILKEKNVIFFESPCVSEDIILKVHTKEWMETVKRGSYWETSLYSTGGVLKATEKVLEGVIDNALIYIGVGGHHAHPDYAWGGCYFNMMAISIVIVREKFDFKRFAIVDIDTHHGDGTRNIFENDDDILHICYCGGYSSKSKDVKDTKICLPHAGSDKEFIEKFGKEIPLRIKEFKPDLIYWVLGLDTHIDSYGTQQLTEKCYPELAKIVKKVADESCKGRLIVKTGCNAPAHVSEYVFPRIVDCLAELNKY